MNTSQSMITRNKLISGFLFVILIITFMTSFQFWTFSSQIDNIPQIMNNGKLFNLYEFCNNTFLITIWLLGISIGLPALIFIEMHKIKFFNKLK